MNFVAEERVLKLKSQQQKTVFLNTFFKNQYILNPFVCKTCNCTPHYAIPLFNEPSSECSFEILNTTSCYNTIVSLKSNLTKLCSKCTSPCLEKSYEISTSSTGHGISRNFFDNFDRKRFYDNAVNNSKINRDKSQVHIYQVLQGYANFYGENLNDVLMDTELMSSGMKRLE